MTTRTLAMAGAVLMAAWVGLGAAVVSELTTVKDSIDTVARHHAKSVPVVGLAERSNEAKANQRGEM